MEFQHKEVLDKNAHCPRCGWDGHGHITVFDDQGRIGRECGCGYTWPIRVSTEIEDASRRCIICDAPYDQGREWTCSDDCHKELVRRLIAEFGEFKKVIRQSTGVAYKVPTFDILEKGAKEEDLDKYPLWEEEGAK